MQIDHLTSSLCLHAREKDAIQPSLGCVCVCQDLVVSAGGMAHRILYSKASCGKCHGVYVRFLHLQ